MCILDISKTCLYEFYHEYMISLFRENCYVHWHEYLIYHIKCDDIYDIMKCDINKFNTSDYVIDNAYDIPLVNKKIPDLMKDNKTMARWIRWA